MRRARLVSQFDEARPAPRLLRWFSASWSFFLGAGGWYAFRHDPHSAAWLWLLLVAGIFSVGLFFPAMMKPVFLAIERLMKPVGEAMSTLLLAIVYFSVFSFFALVMRMAGRDLLRVKRPGWGSTAWEKKNPEPRPFGYFGQY